MVRLSQTLCKLFLSSHFSRPSISSSSIAFKSLIASPSPIRPSNSPVFLHYIASNPTIRFRPRETLHLIRAYSSVDTNREVDTINLKFAEAREEIEIALESKETVYFDEEAGSARAAVKEVLEMFDGLLEKLDENEKAALKRSMGLKIEQLKAEVNQLNE